MGADSIFRPGVVPCKCTRQLPRGLLNQEGREVDLLHLRGGRILLRVFGAPEACVRCSLLAVGSFGAGKRWWYIEAQWL